MSPKGFARRSGRIRVIHPSSRAGVVSLCCTHAESRPYADRVTGSYAAQSSAAGSIRQVASGMLDVSSGMGRRVSTNRMPSIGSRLCDFSTRTVIWSRCQRSSP